MKGKRYTPRRPRRSRHRLQILLAILLGLVLLWGVDMRLRPLVEQVAGYQCRVAVLEVMNEAIEEELEKAQWGTKELVTTKYNPDGSIAALEMDAIALNRLKAELTQAISNELLAMGEQRVDIPLGTMLGWQFLTGRGPDIPLKLIPASFVQSSVTDVFETAGINQTQHRGNAVIPSGSQRHFTGMLCFCFGAERFLCSANFNCRSSAASVRCCTGGEHDTAGKF